MTSHENVYRDLLSASAGEIPFNAAIGSAVRHFGAGGGIIFEINRKTGQILDWATPTLIVGDDGYNAHINAINPRMRYSLRHAPGHIAYEGRFISERGIDRSEFYDWLQRTAGFRYMLGSRVYDDGDASVFCSMEFTKSHGHPDADKIEAFGRFVPTLGHAWRLRRRAAGDREAAELQTWLPDHLPWSIFALSPSGTVTGMNAAARAMADTGDVLAITLDRLHAVDRRSDPAFQGAVRCGLEGTASEALVETGRGDPPLVVQVIPIAPRSGVSSRIAALVYVRDPLDKAHGIGAVLGRLYGLTLAEQKLADVLATGADLPHAAALLGLSRNTVRNRMQAIHAKTGTRRHSEFLVRILRLLEP